MKRCNGQFKSCYERERNSNPDIAGKVTVAFEVETNGMVAARSCDTEGTRGGGLGFRVIKKIP